MALLGAQEHQEHLKQALLALFSMIHQPPICITDNINLNTNYKRTEILHVQQTNLSPEVEHRSVHWTCTVPAIPNPAQETFGRIAIWTLSLSFLAAKRDIFKVNHVRWQGNYEN